MKKRIRLAQSHFRRIHPGDPVIKSIKQWFRPNQGFYDNFRAWLHQGGYSDNAITLYSVSVRLALGLLDKAYWMIDPETDLGQVRDYIATHYPSAGTRQSYLKGLSKLAQYLRLRTHRPKPEKPINWDYYCASLPDWLVADIRAHLAYRRRAWLPDLQRRRTLDTLSHLTGSLRWMAQQTPLITIAAITPNLWFDYVDYRLATGITPTTLNGELGELQQFLRCLAEQERPVCTRMLRIEPLAQGPSLPRDVPREQLHRLREQIEIDAASSHAGIRRMGLMDRAWFLLMLHSGLRTGEVRCLRLDDLNLEARRARIEQSKGLKDRLVYFSQPTVDALRAYFAVRGPANTEHVFLFRHEPLSVTYCLQRMATYSKRCGIKVTPHQLRHSCATLLLNAGAPILTVQMLLGHKHIDTTLGYARLYDGTIAHDYYRAMAHIERRFEQDAPTAPPDPAQLLAMVDALQNGTLNDRQRETVQQLRDGLLAMSRQEPLLDSIGS